MADHNILYFRNLWQKNVSDLENQCDVWEKTCSDCEIPDDVNGEIRTAIGLARLLMNQKLKQFKGLIDDSEFHTGEKEITCSDLEGFWDMVYYEIEKIHKSFERLTKCKNNGWEYVEEISEKHIKKIPIKKDISAINKKKEISKAQMLAARQRIAEVKKRMAAQCKEEDSIKVDILLPNKKGLVENIANEKKPNQVSSKKNTSFKSTGLLEESSDLNDKSKQKSAQKKKFTISNKENTLKDNDSSDLKNTGAKQAKYNESVIQELEKVKKKHDFMKLQCVTRSAAKKALALQQNSL